jgi:hypothetical protein
MDLSWSERLRRQTIVSELAKAVRVKGLVDCCLRKWIRTAILLLVASWMFLQSIHNPFTTTMAAAGESHTEHDEILSDDGKFLEDDEEGVRMGMMALVVTHEFTVEVGYTTVTIGFCCCCQSTNPPRPSTRSSKTTKKKPSHPTSG